MNNKKERKYCRAETKKNKNLQRRKKNRDEIEEKRWFEGWIMLMADGYGEESGLEREKEEEKKKKKKRKKRDGKDETGHHKWRPSCQYIYGNAIENRVMETENS